MARGMVVGEPITSQAGTEQFREGYDRTFGDKKPQRGRWVWDAEAGRLVSAVEYAPPSRALDAPIISDRIHEGTTFDDGERVCDIGSRRKRREFMRARGLEDATDASPQYRENVRKQMERDDDRRRDAAFDAAARKFYAQGKLR